jgi:hypothetical protein
MKKRFIPVAVCLICGSMLFSSCVGSFALFNKVATWNRGVSTKFVNELIFLALNIVPVYEVATFVDAVVLNSIEFWKGENPLAKAGEVKKVKGENGNYMVETLENGYNITKEGEDASMKLIYDKDESTWNVEANGETEKLVKMNDDDTATLFLPDGKSTTITLDANGMMAARQIAEGAALYACR